MVRIIRILLRVSYFILIVLAIFALWYVMLHSRSIADAFTNEWRKLLLSAAIVIVLVFVIRLIIRRLGRRIFLGIFALVNRFRPWHKLPTALATLNLAALRISLREKNLHDTPEREDLPAPGWDPGVVAARTADGSFNDLNDPNMGRAGMRFGHNIPLSAIVRQKDIRINDPSPREVSRVLLTRDVFRPAEILNLAAAGFIQFMVHGWVNHRRSSGNNPEYHEIPLKEDDNWHENPMRIRKTLPDSEETAEFPVAYENTESHWWGASQLYGSHVERQKLLRYDDQSPRSNHGKLKTVKHPKFNEERLPEYEDRPGIDLTGFFDNYWVGLSMFHTIFALEHNAICDHLQRAYPAWSNEQLFQKARLINSALIAKIHTLEWTLAILQHPALKIAMGANWWGMLGERFKRALGRVSDAEEISGIIGSETDHHTASFSMTEEFTTVYRLHPLIPDEVEYVSLATGESLGTKPFVEMQGDDTRDAMKDVSMADLFYSFGIVHPGAVTLHNFPKSLQEFTRRAEDITETIDLAAMDILRDRERGVPRYNEFRKLMRMKPIDRFEDLTENPEWAKEIDKLYNGKINDVDTMVGMFAETPPKGFGFSDTAFRIFILMASRRLKSDRFFTTDYTADVYTQLGLDWIDENNMRSVLLRHYPELAPALHGVENAFAPWNTISHTRPA